jgi:hypothetical protein
MILCDLLCRNLVLVVKLATVLGRKTQLLATAQQPLGQALMIGRVIAIEESLIAALDNEFGDIHDCDDDKGD